jgi:hypothetical protein
MKDLLLLPGIEPLFLGHPACSLVSIPTELSRTQDRNRNRNRKK